MEETKDKSWDSVENNETRKLQIDLEQDKVDLSMEASNSLNNNRMASERALVESTYETPFGTSPSPLKDNFESSVDNRLSFREYVTPVEDIYEEMNSGELYAKYENFKVGSNNEERLAREQGSGEVWGRGLSRFVNQTTTAFVGNLAAIPVGLTAWINTGNFEATYDNEFMRWLDDLDRKSQLNNNIYYTEEQKNSIFGSPSRFIADKLLGGASFTVGMIASEAALAALTSGISLTGTGARISARVGVKALTKEVGGSIAKGLAKGRSILASTAAADKIGYKTLRNAVKHRKSAETFLDLAKDARFLLTSTAYEAGMETRHFKDQATDDFKNYYDRLGIDPTLEEKEEFDKYLQESQNGVLIANSLILGVSNAAIFGKMFGVGNTFSKAFKPASQAIDKSIWNIGTKEMADGTFKALNRKKWQKVLNPVWDGIVKPAFTEGVWEEGGQGIASGMMAEYMQSTYDPEVSREIKTKMDAFYKAAKEQYSTKEGLEEVLIGGIIGSIFGGLSGGFTRSSKKASMQEGIASVETRVAKAPKDIIDAVYTEENFLSQMGSANRSAKIEKSLEKDVEEGNFAGSTLKAEALLISSLQAAHSVGKDGSFIDVMKGSIQGMDNQKIMDTFGFENIEQAEAFKAEKIEALQQVRKSYETNRGIAETMVGRDQLPEGFQGKESLLVDSLAFSLSMSQASERTGLNSIRSIKELFEEAGASKDAETMDVLGMFAMTTDELKQEYREAEENVKTITSEIDQITKDLKKEQEKPTAERNVARITELEGQIQDALKRQSDTTGVLNGVRETIGNQYFKKLGGVGIASMESLTNLEQATEQSKKTLESLRNTNPRLYNKLALEFDTLDKSVQYTKEFSDIYRGLLDSRFSTKVRKRIFGNKAAKGASLNDITRDTLNKILETPTNILISEENTFQPVSEELSLDPMAEEGESIKPKEVEPLTSEMEEAINNNEQSRAQELKQIQTQENTTKTLVDTFDSLVLSMFEFLNTGFRQSTEADIERRSQEVERISKLPFAERISALKKAGIISSNITYNLGKRFPVILNIAGVKVAFYRSSEGTGGKQKGSWTPMFGFGQSKGNPWLIKGNIDTQVNTNYNSDAIQEYADILNKTLNWEHGLDRGRVKNHPYFKEFQVVKNEQAFNEELYGVKDLGIINGETDVSGFINSKLQEINAKYDAELAALENGNLSTKQAEKQIPPQVRQMLDADTPLNTDPATTPVQRLYKIRNLKKILSKKDGNLRNFGENFKTFFGQDLNQIKEVVNSYDESNVYGDEVTTETDVNNNHNEFYKDQIKKGSMSKEQALEQLKNVGQQDSKTFQQIEENDFRGTQEKLITLREQLDKFLKSNKIIQKYFRKPETTLEDLNSENLTELELEEFKQLYSKKHLGSPFTPQEKQQLEDLKNQEELNEQEQELLKELSEKEQTKGNLTNKELNRLEELEQNLLEYNVLQGTNFNGASLLELLRLYESLKKQIKNEEENKVELTEDDYVDIALEGDKKNDADFRNSAITQNVEYAMVRFKKGINISHLHLSDLLDMIIEKHPGTTVKINGEETSNFEAHNAMSNTTAEVELPSGEKFVLNIPGKGTKQKKTGVPVNLKSTNYKNDLKTLFDFRVMSVAGQKGGYYMVYKENIPVKSSDNVFGESYQNDSGLVYDAAEARGVEVGEVVELVYDNTDTYNKTLNQDKVSELAAQANIYVVKNGKIVGKLKSTENTTDSDKFYEIRKNAVQNRNVKIEVSSVLMGLPIIQMSEEGLKNNTSIDKSQILGQGYYLQNESNKSIPKGVSRRFIEAASKKNPTRRVPYVIVEDRVSKRKVAFPIEVVAQKNLLTITKFEDILGDNTQSDIQKAIELNNLLVQQGVYDLRFDQRSVKSSSFIGEVREVLDTTTEPVDLDKFSQDISSFEINSAVDFRNNTFTAPKLILDFESVKMKPSDTVVEEERKPTPKQGVTTKRQPNPPKGDIFEDFARKNGATEIRTHIFQGNIVRSAITNKDNSWSGKGSSYKGTWNGVRYNQGNGDYYAHLRILMTSDQKSMQTKSGFNYNRNFHESLKTLAKELRDENNVVVLDIRPTAENPRLNASLKKDSKSEINSCQ